MTDMTEQEARTAAQLAIGRLLRIGSRPYQEGDIEEFYRLRSVVMEASEILQLNRK
jgi:hypothetical protein